MNTIHENSSTEYEDNKSEHEESFEDFAMEYTPKKAKAEKQDGINIKGKSDEFKDASEKILKMMGRNGKKLTIWENKVKITYVTKSGYSTTINVEVTTKTGDSGEANLIIYNKGSMRLTKKRGEDVKYVQTLSESIIRPLLRKIMSGDVANMEKKFLNNTLKRPEIVKKTICPDKENRCNICDKVFASSQALLTHTVEHKQISKNKNKYSLNVELSETSKEVICDKCGRVMENSKVLKEHIASHHKVYPTTPKPPNWYQCDQCNDKFETKNALNDHIEDIHEQSNSPEQKRKKLMMKKKP